MSTVKLALILAAWSTTMKGSLKTLLTKAFANPRNSGLRDLNGFGNGIVDPSWPVRTLVGFEEDASVHKQTSRRSTCSNQALKMVTFAVGQDDRIFLIHAGRIPTPIQEIKLGVTEY